MTFTSISRAMAALTCLAVIATAPDPAQAFRSTFPLDVLQVPDSRAFEVVEAHGAGPRQIWCAAAEHGRDTLRLPNATRLYIAQGRSPSSLAPGRTTVRFSPDPVEPVGPRQSGAYAVSLRDIGFSLSIGHALAFCNDNIEDLFDKF
ncbi:MAG: hypothetical protein ACNA7Q_10800 [Rhodobacterales bacterium]